MSATWSILLCTLTVRVTSASTLVTVGTPSSLRSDRNTISLSTSVALNVFFRLNQSQLPSKPITQLPHCFCTPAKPPAMTPLILILLQLLRRHVCIANGG